MSPTFEVTLVLRPSKMEWEDLGQHGEPPQATPRRVVRWSQVEGIEQFVDCLYPQLTMPANEQACVLKVDYMEWVVLADYDELWRGWDEWLESERKRRALGDNYRLN